MKKAIKININSVIFHIDEDAYEKLNSYLKTVELYFSGKDGGKEIVDDIESRIAELFLSRVSTQKEVITLSDVTEVTAIMGDPSDFVGEADEEPEDNETREGDAKRFSKTGPKRLYRDPENAVFGGVCGGLGAYFGIDPIILRILFVILLIAGYGVWGFVYIVLWIAIPKAVSIAQKLEMRGERVTISNIEKTVKQEYQEVKTNFKKLEKSEGYKQATSAIGEIFQVIGRIFLIIARVVLILLGVALVFSGFILLMSFMGIFFFKSTLFSFGWFSGSIFPLEGVLSSFVDPVNITVVLVALFFAVIIPLITIIYGGIKLIFQINTRDRGIGVVALIFWIASISVLFTVGFIESRKYAFKGVSQENVVISAPPSRTLYLQLNDNVNTSVLEDLTWFHSPARGIYYDTADERFWSRPSLRITQVSGDRPELVIERRARGASQLYSELNADNLVYEWELSDSLLIFDNMFTCPPGDPIVFSEISLRLNLPEGHSVFIGDKMDRIITSARTKERNRISSMSGKTWNMTGEGLILED